ncbi:hypothetical protein FHN55_02545 [Streptomyces sp. NP160]|uniref:AMIN-like domain-containing (lipo)protein n=1 Tax=Streptomyces sp. NP160 TaxID=2586637 RepID=UPI00111B3009|nr:hypothetical protein [Streptomyces sp. NP160]TNM69649.1 hypothetical protein FHN55_02545 [Streptomyces sp. NP160]
MDAWRSRGGAAAVFQHRRQRRVRRVLASGSCCAALVLSSAVGLPGAADAAAAQARPAPVAAAVLTSPAHPTVTGVRTGRHTGFDRVVIDFTGGVPQHRERWLPRGERLRADGSGRVVPLQGDRVLEVVITGADRFQAARRTAPKLPAVRSTYLSPSFEATVQVGVGVRTADGSRGRVVRVVEIHGEHPRLVIDIAHPRR